MLKVQTSSKQHMFDTASPSILPRTKTAHMCHDVFAHTTEVGMRIDISIYRYIVDILFVDISYTIYRCRLPRRYIEKKINYRYIVGDISMNIFIDISRYIGNWYIYILYIIPTYK